MLALERALLLELALLFQSVIGMALMLELALLSHTAPPHPPFSHINAIHPPFSHINAIHPPFSHWQGVSAKIPRPLVTSRWWKAMKRSVPSLTTAHPCTEHETTPWYGRSLWRMAGGRNVQVRFRIGTVPLGRHCGQACAPPRNRI